MYKLTLILILIIFFSVVELKSQDVEVYNRTFIGVGLSGVLTNSSYGEDNFGIDVSFRRNFKLKVPNSYYCINAKYINYKNDSITKNDYSVSLGTFHISDPIKNTDSIFSISYCSGVEFGMLYKNELYYGCFSINNGFVWKIYKNLNFEFMFKTKYNPSDEFYTECMLGLSYSF